MTAALLEFPTKTDPVHTGQVGEGSNAHDLDISCLKDAVIIDLVDNTGRETTVSLEVSGGQIMLRTNTADGLGAVSLSIVGDMVEISSDRVDNTQILIDEKLAGNTTVC